MYRYPLYIILFISSLFLNAQNGEETFLNPEIKHDVSVIHPSIHETESFKHFLFQNNANKQFYAEIVSVICETNVCKVVPVKMYWNELGKFTHYTLDEGDTLEKTEGAPFTKADYSKLDVILNNIDSPLKEVHKTDIEDYSDVDANSGATIIVEEDEIVKGAAWTCYTLWHWANGTISNFIKKVTVNSLKNKDLITYLKSEKKEYQLFAIEQLTQKKIHDSVTVNEVVNQIKTQDYTFSKKSKDYIQSIQDASLYTKTINQLLNLKESKKRLVFLNALYKSDKELSITFFENIAPKLIDYYKYQELHLYFNILEKRSLISDKIITTFIPLLNGNDFLTSRRTYWFLNNHDLNTSQKKELNNFEEKYTNKL